MNNNNFEDNFDNKINQYINSFKNVELSESEQDKLIEKLINSDKIIRQKRIFVISTLREFFISIYYKFRYEYGIIKPAYTLITACILISSYLIFHYYTNKEIDSNETINNQKQDSKPFQNVEPNQGVASPVLKELDCVILSLNYRSFGGEKNRKKISDIHLFDNSFKIIEKVLSEAKVNYKVMNKYKIVTDWYFYDEVKSRMIIERKKSDEPGISFNEEKINLTHNDKVFLIKINRDTYNNIIVSFKKEYFNYLEKIIKNEN